MPKLPEIVPVDVTTQIEKQDERNLIMGELEEVFKCPACPSVERLTGVQEAVVRMIWPVMQKTSFERFEKRQQELGSTMLIVHILTAVV